MTGICFGGASGAVPQNFVVAYCIVSKCFILMYDICVSQITMSQLQITGPAPSFKGMAVVNGAFKQISLSDYAGKYLVLIFYPTDFTFVCPTEIISFSDRAEEFRKINCELIACSTDSHFSHLAW